MEGWQSWFSEGNGAFRGYFAVWRLPANGNRAAGINGGAVELGRAQGAGHGAVLPLAGYRVLFGCDVCSRFAMVQR